MPPLRSAAPPRYLIIGQAGSTNVTTDRRFVIQDGAFVQRLFTTLSQPSTNRYPGILWMAPRPLIFVDEQWNVCRGLTCMAARQWLVLRPRWVERFGNDYVLTGGEQGDYRIPQEAFKGYFDVWNTAIP